MATQDDYLARIQADGRTPTLHDRVNAKRMARGKKPVLAVTSPGRWVSYGGQLRYARAYGDRFGIYATPGEFVELDPQTCQPV